MDEFKSRPRINAEVLLAAKVHPELARKIHLLAEERHFATTSEYLRALVREDIERWEAAKLAQQPQEVAP